MPYSPLELAYAFIQTGELADALDALNTHLTDYPGDDDARRLRAAVLMRTPGDDAKRAALDDLNMLGAQTIADHIQRSTLLHHLGDSAGAAAAAQTAWDANRADERVAELLINRLIDSGAAGQAARVLQHMPDTWRWMRWSAAVAERARDFVRAAERYTDALDALARVEGMSPLLAASLRSDMLLARANVYAQSGALDSADADYRAAESIVPGDEMIRFNRGLLAALRGDMLDALALCGEALAAANSTLEAHMASALRADPRYVGLAALLLSDD